MSHGEWKKGTVFVLFPLTLRPISVAFRNGRDSRARKERSDGIARFYRASRYFSVRMERTRKKATATGEMAKGNSISTVPFDVATYQRRLL